MTSTTILKVVGAVSAVALLVLPGTAALAAEAEPAVSTTAWYWESQQSQKVTDPTSGADIATIEAPNPFCPSTSIGGPPEEAGSCKEGRLPVEVQNSDYETPDKISAVGFDLSLIPLGSEVKEMTVKFLEANDDQSAPVNGAGKKLQACFVQEFFGPGEARVYREAPRFECLETDPIAERKEVQVENEEGEKEDRFQYKFDLTPFAVRWIEEGKLQSSIMLFPVQPEESEFEASTDSNWRVVLSGPAATNGVITKVRYTPGELPSFGGLDGGFDPGGGFGDAGSFGTGSTGSFDAGAPLDSDTGVDPTATAEAPADEEPSVLDSLAAEETSDTAQPGLPGYVWLAILAGLVGFSLVRQVVLEQAAGIRPNGVLAQIRRVNADRRGGSIDDADVEGPGRFDDVISGLAEFGNKTSRFLSNVKLPFRRG